MDKVVIENSSLANVETNGTDTIQQQFIVDNRLKLGVTVVESNGSSVVLMKDSNNTTNSVISPLATNNVIGESVSKLATETTVKTPQTGLALTDVGFTSLLSKHLYSTTMTGSSSQTNEILTEVKPSNTVPVAKKDTPAVVMLPPQSPVNVIHPDILRMGTLLNNQNLIVGNGQNMPQIIYVPIIAAPPTGSSEGIVPGTSASPILASPVAPLNYGMIGALPLSSSASNINNVVYVQPQLPATPLINPTLPQSSTPLNSAVTTQSLLNTLVQQQSSLLNIAVQNPTSLLNLAVQPQTPLLNPQTPLLNPQTPLLNPQIPLLNPQTPLLNPQTPLINLAVQPTSTLLNPAEHLSSEVKVTENIMLPIVETNEQNVLATTAEPKKRGQKRKVSRHKSCSSDASSVDSNMTEGPSPSSGIIRQTVFQTKKIERVRKTVNTEEELNSKVSGLVSKILSQFPKTPSQSNNKSRPSPKSPKRNKQESNNNISLPNTLNNETVTNMMIPSTVMLAGEENGPEVAYHNVSEANQHIVNTDNTQTILVNPSSNNLGGSISSNQASTIPVTMIHTNEINSLPQSVTTVVSTENAQLVTQDNSVLQKPLVSRIELSSILPNPPALSNPAVIVESTPGQIPFEYVQIVQGGNGAIGQSFAVQAVQEVSVTTDPGPDTDERGIRTLQAELANANK